MGERYDATRHKWNKWVRDYNAIKQKALFEVFGFDSQDGKSIALILGIGIAISTLIVLLFLYVTRPKRKLNAYDKIHLKFTRLISKNGLKTGDNLGIIKFSSCANKQFPQAKQSINEFTNLYLKLRFSGYSGANKRLEKRLHYLLRKIAIKLKEGDGGQVF
jgi:hypothetical protein